MSFPVQLILRMPRLAIAVVLLALAAFAGTIGYAAYLTVGVVAEYLGTSRFLAGLVLGILFVRLPQVRRGKLHTIGLLPKSARLPVTVGLLALCSLHFFVRGDMVPTAFLVLAAMFLLAMRRTKKRFTARVFSTFIRPTQQAANARHTDKTMMDETIIDAEFREKKDEDHID